MLAAEIWHWWIGIILLAAGLGSVFALVVGYLKNVSSQRYPSKRQRDA